MAGKFEIKENQRIGRWVVLGQYVKTAKGEKKWLCRCECGTERYVLERALKSGGSLSCGCLRKERAAQAVAHDLTGMRFGDLTVIRKKAPIEESGGTAVVAAGVLVRCWAPCWPRGGKPIAAVKP